MHFDILTLFPAMFEGPFKESIIKRAVEASLISIAIHNIRDFATDKHSITDDVPYGGGGGMIMKPDPVFAAVEAILGIEGKSSSLTPHFQVPIILLSPQGRLFTQKIARELSRYPRLFLICGHYEGIDERVRQYLATDEISIGDYVLTGGEIPAMVLVDTVTRLVPGVLGDPSATFEDSHASGLLEYPHYTRPAVFRGYHVPQVLLSGNHAQIARWRRHEALRRTWRRRSDLLAKAKLSEADQAFLEEVKGQEEET